MVEAGHVCAAVFGAAGRMGQAVIETINDDPQVKLGVAIERADHPSLGMPIPSGNITYQIAADANFAACNTLIVFTTPAGIPAAVECAITHRLALVIGTTGMEAEHQQTITTAQDHVPVLVEPNMSLGINMLCQLVTMAARSLPHWDAEIIDLHHRAKLDAPSGTAVKLSEVINNSRTGKQDLCADRTTRSQTRPDDEIGIATLRAGDVVGEHTVLLAGAGERLELTHRATSRRNFAAGAVYAAKSLVGKPPGRYGLDELLAGQL